MLTPSMIAEVKAIEVAHGGEVPVDAVVDKARDPASALHAFPAFKWDLQQAAMAHWRDAAGQVIRIFVTVADRGDGDRETMRAYVSMTNDEGRRTYQPTQRVLKENRTRLIEQTLDRLASIIASYPIVEFDPIVAAINQVREEVTRPPARPSSRRRREEGRERRT